MPIGHVLVRDLGRDVEHDDAALTLDVVTVSKAAKLFLTCRVPDIEADGAKVGVEGKRVNFDTEGGCTGGEKSSEGRESGRADVCAIRSVRRIHSSKAYAHFFSNSPVK